MRRCSGLALVVVALMFFSTAPIAAQEATAVSDGLFLPPDATVAGLDRGEWAARAWQWTLSFPSAMNPTYDETGERCGYGQHGPVFFLAGAPGNVERACAIPGGVTLFVPLGWAECSTVEPPPWHGKDEAELRACVKDAVDFAEGALDMASQAVSVDGQSAGDLAGYRTQTPLFSLVLPEGNDLDVPAGIAQAVGDGYVVMIAPLSEGNHVLTATTPGPDGPITVTYNLTVGAGVEPATEVAGADEIFDGQIETGDGRKLHVRCAGTGSPTLLYEAGGPDDLGASGVVGAPGLSEDLAGISRFCAYDRASQGSSDPAPEGVRTLADSVEDLHVVMSSPAVACPCVLIGESLGGDITLLLAATYPDSVAGLILLDAPPPGFVDQLAALAPAGSAEAELVAGIENPEGLDFPNTLRLVTAPLLRAGTPVIVITHGVGEPPPCFPCSDGFPADELETWWQSEQVELAAALDGRLVVADKSDHFIADNRPDLIITAAQQVVEAVRDPSTWDQSG